MELELYQKMNQQAKAMRDDYIANELSIPVLKYLKAKGELKDEGQNVKVNLKIFEKGAKKGKAKLTIEGYEDDPRAARIIDMYELDQAYVAFFFQSICNVLQKMLNPEKEILVPHHKRTKGGLIIPS